MSGILLCGKRAQNPLYIKNEGINVYSMEELSYYLYNNLYTTDPGIFGSEFLDFVEKGQNMEILSKRIKDLMFRKEPYTSIIKLIISESGYYSEEEKKEFYREMRIFENKSYEERLKDRADILAENGKYNEAVKLYINVLNYKMTDEYVLAAVKNNIGSIYARMFQFEKALEYFISAYEMQKEEEYLDNIICSVLFMESDKVFFEKWKVILLEKFQITDEVFDTYKEAIDNARDYVMEEPLTKQKLKILEFNGEKELKDYYKEADNVIEMWKNTYREDYDGIIFRQN